MDIAMHVDFGFIVRQFSWAMALLVAPTVASLAEERDRDKIPDQYKWDLTPLYPSDQAWRSEKEKLVLELPELEQFRGTLARSAARLADALESRSRLARALRRLSVYAGLRSDQDTRVSAYQGMQQEVIQLASRLGAETAYIEPEILNMEKATIEGFLADEPRLGVYRQYLDDILRRRPHTLAPGEEKLLAQTGVLASGPFSIFNILSNADFSYPTVVLSDGRSIKLDKAAYSLHRASAVREDREKVMSTFFNTLGAYRGTFGALMNCSVEASAFYARARNYANALEASLDGPNIPTSVYARLIEGVNRNLPSFYRYLKLRQRIVGVRDLHYYDLYAPLVPSIKDEYPVEAAERNILDALAVLGPEYTAGAKRAFNERWIDLYPSAGKAAGAYSNGEAYDVHPYMLLNYNGKYQDMGTLAHELGHTMHSYFSNRAQPYPLARYHIFVAEVASTFNEALLMDHMLKITPDAQTRLLLLGNYLENFKGTVFRQTQFSEFELGMHEMVERGEPLTGDALSKLYTDIVRKYYGHDQGILIVDDYVAHEWAFIPHFYNDYYVFQYATSFTASSALAEKVLSGDPGSIERYLRFISAGKSKYPIALLQDAGVDMTSDEPLELTLKKMNRVMDEIEKLLDEKNVLAES